MIAAAIEQGAMARKWKFHTNTGKIFLTVSDRALEQAAQRACGVPFYGDIQARSGCLLVQPAVGDLLCRGVGLDPWWSLSTPTIL